MARSRGAIAQAGGNRRGNRHQGFRPQAVRGRDGPALRKGDARSRCRHADRSHSEGRMRIALSTPRTTTDAKGRPVSFAAGARVRIVGLLRAVPIRWRILSIAALNSAVVIVLAVLIWKGAKVLGSARDDLRQVHESDKTLALLESETSHLQN